MDQIVSEEEEEEEDLNAQDIENGRLSFDVSEQNVVIVNDDDLINPLIREDKKSERNSQSLDLSDKKFDNVKYKKTRKPSSKPPRPPKGPSLSDNDQKMVREIAELAMRKRARIERMRRLREAKSSSSSPCSSVFAMIVTVLFFVFLIFQGFFTSNASLTSENSPAPTVKFYNEFTPRERIDPTSLRYKRVSGADNEESIREIHR
ncbi:unnamed protein product [Cochlearia groenlandica]